ncbi:MAG TPA: cell division topological specificity factor MinE [Anaerolineaceae bacterium]|nr:cell division topological specificity factor MinE [Anaerolineaceae bacterium]HPN53110.1 cell division topological specificity factor MinE [Anaerolineaceae bacterium]
MPNLLELLTGRKPASAGQAKQRLQFVLQTDRTNLTPKMLADLKDELMQVISRYVEIDPDTVNISMTHEGREHRLVADIPLKATHR